MKTEVLKPSQQPELAGDVTRQPAALAQVIDRVASDANQQPKRYLDEVVVPDGGE